MSIIIREKEYIVVPKDPTNGELGPALDTINSNTKSDIGSETKKALAHYLSDATLGKVKNITKSKFGVYDDSIVETTLESQPIRITNPSFAVPIPLATTGNESDLTLDSNLLRQPDLLKSYFKKTISVNSASSDLSLTDVQKTINGNLINNDKLFHAGAALTARAANVPNSTGVGFNPKSIVTFTPNQLFALKTAISDLDVVDVLEKIVVSKTIVDTKHESWGQLNAPMIPFLSLNSIVVSTTAAAIVSLIASTLSATISAITLATSTPNILSIADSRKPYGSSTSNNGTSGLLKALGVQVTNNLFPTAVLAGVSSFFGLKPNGIPDVTSIASLVGGDSGFKIIVAREIIRLSIISTTTAINSLQQLDITSASRQITALIRIVNTFAALGDAILTTLNNSQKIELPPQQLRRQSAAPTMYLIPDTLSRELTTVAGLGFANASSETKTIVSNSSDRRSRGSRISTEDRIAFEKILDAEYVPFYFHDIRTNEIIGFNAFLSDLQDSYSPQWDSSDGFGRVDQVHTYKSTSRSLTFSFTIVATNPNDFDEMWTKINKLVTLVYPQFDSGRWVQSDKDGTDRFIQPFSQTFSASPIVRVRIGDVIQSNYSKFGLQRLFGYGEADLKFSNKKVNYAAPIDPNTLSNMLSTALNSPGGGYSFYVGPGTFPLLNGNILQAAKTLDTTVLSSLQSFTAQIVQKISEDSVACSISLNSEDVNAVNPGDARRHANGSGIKNYIGGIYVIPIAALRPTVQTLKKLENSLAPQANLDESGSAELIAFFSEDNNAVVKSFNEVGGRGLAGKIDSLSFNMLDKTSWDITPDRRGPMNVHVNIGFTVIHDIAPGLDKFGMNRSSVYRIGKVI